jgi:hypothetical protein
MSKVKAFISFAAEDIKYRDIFINQAKKHFSDIEVSNYSVQEPCNEKWRTQSGEQIKKIQLMIMLIGQHTDKCDSACWEVAVANEMGIPILGIHIDKNNKGPVPKQLEGVTVIDWAWNSIASTIKTFS